MRGVILAGGTGSRLGALTRVTNKHLLPVGDVPMILHPLGKLIRAGITEILLVTGTEHVGDFIELLGSGRGYGCDLTYRVQDRAGGIAQALGLAERFAGDAQVVVVLGDNVFRDPLEPLIERARRSAWPAQMSLKHVPDPGRYGVAEILNGRVVDIEEKPARPKTQLAVTGMYVYPPDVFNVIRDLCPSARGELEITDVNRHYLKMKRLDYGILDGYWTDAGTHESLALANKLVREEPPL